MKTPIPLTYVLMFFISAITFQVNANGLNSCGFKPIAKAGCVIGRCVNGAWEQVCGSSANEPRAISDSLLNNISNPKLADIPAAIEYRQSREPQQQRYAPPKEATQRKNNSPLAAFEEIIELDMQTALIMMGGFGSAYRTANDVLKLRDVKPLYCQTMALTQKDYLSIYESQYRKNKAMFDRLENADAAMVLLLGLAEEFPCP